MEKVKELYKVASFGAVYHRYAYNKEQALRYFKKYFMKEFGKYEVTDLAKQLPDKSWTRVEF